MSLLILWLSACASCGGQPESIPAEAGKVTEAIAPDLLTAASPDLVVIPWAALYQLSIEDYRDCPLIYLSDTQVYVDAGPDDGCADSAGVRWQGSASASFSDTTVVLNFNDFGPSAGVPSPWTALGSLQLVPTTSGTGQRVTSRMAVTSYGPGDKLDFWNETTGGFSSFDGEYYVDHLNGTLGIEDWGTAEVDENRLPLSLDNGCAYGLHASGSIAIYAQNDAVLRFSTVSQDADLAGPPPPASSDTSFDTADSASTGGGGSTEDGASIPNPTGGTGDLCGECVELTIEGEAIAGCVIPTRTISWPFLPPF